MPSRASRNPSWGRIVGQDRYHTSMIDSYLCFYSRLATNVGSRMRDYYIADVPDEVVAQLEDLKAAGFSYQEVFRYAVGALVVKGLEDCAKELAAARVSKLLAGIHRKVS